MVNTKKLAKILAKAKPLYVQHAEDGTIYMSEGSTVWHVSKETAKDTLKNFPELFEHSGKVDPFRQVYTDCPLPKMQEAIDGNGYEFCFTGTAKITGLVVAGLGEKDSDYMILQAESFYMAVDRRFLDVFDGTISVVECGNSPLRPIRVGTEATIMPVRLDANDKRLAMLQPLTVKQEAYDSLSAQNDSLSIQRR